MGVKERIDEIGRRLTNSNSREFEDYLNLAANGGDEAVPLYGRQDARIYLLGRQKGGVETGAILVPLGNGLYKRTYIRRVGQGPFKVARHEFIEVSGVSQPQ